MPAVDWLAQRARLSPHKTALIDPMTDTSTSFSQWNQQTNRLAHLLLSLGLQKGDLCAVLSMNSIGYLDTWFACAKTGVILQNLNWRLRPHELLALLKQATPTLLAYGTDFLDTIHFLQTELPSIKHWLALDDKGTARPSDLSLSLRETFPSTDPGLSIPFDHPWLICYTGGTTGLPKGATLTHANVFWNAINTITSWGLAPDDLAILNAPLFHVGGLSVFTSPLVYLGGTSVVCKKFDVDMLFDLLQTYPVTVFFGVPTMFLLMQEHPRWSEADFSRLKFVISGGAPCPLPVFTKFWAKGVPFKTGYGLTEAGPNNFWLPPDDLQRKPGSVGFPLMHVSVRVVKDTGEEAAPDEIGELLLRGPHVMQGYWQAPEATAKTLRDGWLHTGDLVRRDAEGYVFIVGRLKDMIISGGENIYPAEIESVLHAIPAVAEAAVIGLPHPTWGEVGVAILRLQPGHTASQDDILAFCKDRLAKYKLPRRILFTDELPKTSAGKLDKRALQEAYAKVVSFD